MPELHDFFSLVEPFSRFLSNFSLELPTFYFKIFLGGSREGVEGGGHINIQQTCCCYYAGEFVFFSVVFNLRVLYFTRKHYSCLFQNFLFGLKKKQCVTQVNIHNLKKSKENLSKI